MPSNLKRKERRLAAKQAESEASGAGNPPGKAAKKGDKGSAKEPRGKGKKGKKSDRGGEDVGANPVATPPVVEPMETNPVVTSKEPKPARKRPWDGEPGEKVVKVPLSMVTDIIWTGKRSATFYLSNLRKLVLEGEKRALRASEKMKKSPPVTLPPGPGESEFIKKSELAELMANQTKLISTLLAQLGKEDRQDRPGTSGTDATAPPQSKKRRASSASNTA